MLGKTFVAHLRGGPRRSGYVDLLGGLMYGVCGWRLRSDGTFADGRHRKLHPEPCPQWSGPRFRRMLERARQELSARMP